MFFTYTRRELRRRARQASIIALGLALGIGLVITVTALSTGVKNAQGEVLHSLYGQDTDITVTKAPKLGSFFAGGGARFRFGGSSSSGKRPKAGTKVTIDNLTSTGLSTLPATDVTSAARLSNVAAAAGGLTLNDTKDSITIPSTSGGNGGFGGFGGGGTGTFHPPTTMSVDGVDLSGNAAALGPLSAGKLVSGRTLAASDATSDVAMLDSNYATSNKLKVGSTVTIAKTSFKIVGIVSQSGGSDATDAFIPLARAQALGTSAGKSLKGDVNTIYVAANGAQNITTVSRELSTLMPGTTVTNQNDLAKQLTGSVTSASNLASNLGRWLAIAVLVAAFLLASLLTTAAVARRVREFGTLKALGWTSRRVVGQVVGESITIGIIGGAIGVGLGFLGSALVGHFSHTLTAAVGPTTGSATPGGARTFTGGGFPGGGGGSPGGGGGFAGGGFARFRPALSSPTVHVHLTPSVSGTAIIVAVVLAIAGGLIAGGFGGWRAARLRPAAALARVE
jgi:ABC-type antimicrobial peptide transport system permease subunit